MLKRKQFVVVPMVIATIMVNATTIKADEPININGMVVTDGTILVENLLNKDKENKISNETANTTVPAESEVCEDTVTDEETANEKTDDITSTITPEVIAITGLTPEVILYCKQAAKDYNISEYILESLVIKESRGNVNAKNGSYIGLTQFNPRFYGSAMTATMCTNPSDPNQNVRVCAYQLAQWNAKYNDMHLVLECWNKGEGKAVAQHTSSGTSYSRTIVNKAAEIESICNKAIITTDLTETET